MLISLVKGKQETQGQDLKLRGLSKPGTNWDDKPTSTAQAIKESK
jgi:hypothetical protein